MNKRVVCLAAALCLRAVPLLAQSSDLVGVRARGMAGAFTAVADDASATWWNPAGLAGGAFFDAAVEFDRNDEPAGSSAAGQSPGRTAGFAAAIPALGVSYYHFRISEMRQSGATGGAGPSREDLGSAGPGVLVGDQVGATVGQSLGDHLVVATTLRLLHGGAEGGASTTAGTLDVGAMASLGRARFGVDVRNLTQPTLGDAAGGAFVLERQARIGAAVMLPGRGRVDGVTLAADADLTTQHLFPADERDAATGGEIWLLARRLGLRGGLSVETVGSSRPAGSVGGSIAVRSGVFAEAALTGGSDPVRRGWSVGLRVTF